jgi:hypothetical protein
MPEETFLATLSNVPQLKELVETGLDVILMGDKLHQRHDGSSREPNREVGPMVVLIGLRDEYGTTVGMPLFSDEVSLHPGNDNDADEKQKPVDHYWLQTIKDASFIAVVPPDVELFSYRASGKCAESKIMVVDSQFFSNVMYRLVLGKDGQMRAEEVDAVARSTRDGMVRGASYVLEIVREDRWPFYVNLFV